MPVSPIPPHRDLLLTVFGLYGRAADGWIPVAHLVQMLSDVGADPSGVRASISRLTKKGTLVNRRKGRRSEYRLSPGLYGAFSAGDRRIFQPRQTSLSDAWLLATFSLSESQRALRHKIRSGLTRLGFGTVSPGLWIAPAHLEEETLEYFERHRLAEHTIFFRAELTADQQPQATWWNLKLLQERYERFVTRYAPLLEQVKPRKVSGSEAFALYIPMLTEWRGLPYLDPGLPEEILPPQWHGQRARSVFAELHELLSARAAEHAHQVLGH